MMYYLVTTRPVQSLAGFLMMLVGLVIYGIAQMRMPAVPIPQVTRSNEPNELRCRSHCERDGCSARTRPGQRTCSCVNDTARVFWRGMEVSATSPLEPLTRDSSWKAHSSLFETAFGKLENQQLVKVRQWSSANLNTSRSMMYYFFSGPDFSTPTRSSPTFPPTCSVVRNRSVRFPTY